jgi:hypothetical protein
MAHSSLIDDLESLPLNTLLQVFDKYDVLGAQNSGYDDITSPTPAGGGRRYPAENRGDR